MVTNSVIFCIAYILGLLSTAVTWGGYGVIGLGILAASVAYFGKRTSYRNKLPNSFWQIKPQLWLLAGGIGFLATVYFQVRTPQPGINDISRFIATSDRQEQTVRGKVVSTPRLTRNQREQFWLEATELKIANASKSVTGKLYVTVPLLQATGLHEGETILVTGNLYKPSVAANPGAFDFRVYLAEEGSFAGLKGREISILQTGNSWGWWAIRQRIIRSQALWVNVPEAPLISAMVLGNRVIDLPFYISDSFLSVGLAHALAASGFQVSLILSLVLNITQRFSTRVQFCFGITALLIFLGLTGFQPSVLRAVLMGIGGLVGLVLQRKKKPLGLLLLAAVLLLLLNPIWIWNLGFEFSFLATLGLVVTVPALIKRLDSIPSAIATLIAVPIAAYIWTLPLQLYKFGLVSPYSIIVNVITTIPLSVISLGAFISAVAALIIPTVGSAIAWLLYYPTHGLIAIIDFFSHLPGSMVAVGTISAIQLITLYILIILLCLQKWWRQQWLVAGLIAIGLILIPVLQTQASIFRVTVIASGKEPVLIVQDKGKVLLVNSGGENKARFTVLPFLQQQGVNQIDWAIATNNLSNNTDWLEILQRLPIKNFYSGFTQQSHSLVENVVRSHHGNYHYLNVGQNVTTGSTSIEITNNQIPTLQLQIAGQTWLILGKPDPQKLASSTLTRAQVLLWSGESLEPEWVKTVQPKVAIATSYRIDPDTMSSLRQAKAKVFITGRDGAVQWTPDGFETTLETLEEKASAL